MKLLKLRSPLGVKSITYSWPLTSTFKNANDKENEVPDIIQTMQWISEDYPEIKQQLEKSILVDYNINCYESVRRVCKQFNVLTGAIANVESGISIAQKRIKKQASRDLLHHIMQQVYIRAVDDPRKLNNYKAFSPAVYGETSYDYVCRIIDFIQISPQDVFIDLGSGIGQVVLQMAASTPCKKCIGIECGEIPNKYALKMDKHFKEWMAWFGKEYGSYELISGDFLHDQFRKTILQSSVIFSNNWAFGPCVDHHLKELFLYLKDGTKIVSTINYRPHNFRVSNRTVGDVGSIMKLFEIPPLPDAVSWTGKPFSFYLQVIDRTKLNEFFDKGKITTTTKEPKDNELIKSSNSKTLSRKAEAKNKKKGSPQKRSVRDSEETRQLPEKVDQPKSLVAINKNPGLLQSSLSEFEITESDNSRDNCFENTVLYLPKNVDQSIKNAIYQETPPALLNKVLSTLEELEISCNCSSGSTAEELNKLQEKNNLQMESLKNSDTSIRSPSCSKIIEQGCSSSQNISWQNSPLFNRSLENHSLLMKNQVLDESENDELVWNNSEITVQKTIDRPDTFIVTNEIEDSESVIENTNLLVRPGTSILTSKNPRYLEKDSLNIGKKMVNKKPILKKNLFNSESNKIISGGRDTTINCDAKRECVILKQVKEIAKQESLLDNLKLLETKEHCPTREIEKNIIENPNTVEEVNEDGVAKNIESSNTEQGILNIMLATKEDSTTQQITSLEKKQDKLYTEAKINYMIKKLTSFNKFLELSTRERTHGMLLRKQTASLSRAVQELHLNYLKSNIEKYNLIASTLKLDEEQLPTNTKVSSEIVLPYIEIEESDVSAESSTEIASEVEHTKLSTEIVCPKVCLDMDHSEISKGMVHSKKSTKNTFSQTPTKIIRPKSTPIIPPEIEKREILTNKQSKFNTAVKTTKQIATAEINQENQKVLTNTKQERPIKEVYATKQLAVFAKQQTFAAPKTLGMSLKNKTVKLSTEVNKDLSYLNIKSKQVTKTINDEMVLSQINKSPPEATKEKEVLILKENVSEKVVPESTTKGEESDCLGIISREVSAEVICPEGIAEMICTEKVDPKFSTEMVRRELSTEKVCSEAPIEIACSENPARMMRTEMEHPEISTEVERTGKICQKSAKIVYPENLTARINSKMKCPKTVRTETPCPKSAENVHPEQAIGMVRKEKTFGKGMFPAGMQFPQMMELKKISSCTYNTNVEEDKMKSLQLRAIELEKEMNAYLTSLLTHNQEHQNQASNNQIQQEMLEPTILLEMKQLQDTILRLKSETISLEKAYKENMAKILEQNKTSPYSSRSQNEKNSPDKENSNTLKINYSERMKKRDLRNSLKRQSYRNSIQIKKVIPKKSLQRLLIKRFTDQEIVEKELGNGATNKIILSILQI